MYTIYGKPNCSYCTKAKSLLEERGIAYAYHDIISDIEQRQILLNKLPNLETVPQIYDGEHHVGGYTELTTYI